MDSNGRLRHIDPEELLTMESLDHPVNSIADLPVSKLALFKKIEKGVNRKDRKAWAKRLGVDWSEYQIYRGLL